MKNQAVRAALCLLVVLAFAGAGYELATLDRHAAAARDAARAFEETARRIETSLHELRAAQFAYVAAGQGATFWTGRATTLIQAIGADLKKLDTFEKGAIAAGVGPGGPGCTPALDELAAVQRIDTSVQAYVREEQRLLASDLVFTDLREADQALAMRIEDCRRRTAAAEALSAGLFRRKQIATAGGAAVFALLVLFLLLPTGRRRLVQEPSPASAGVLHLEPPAATRAPTERSAASPPAAVHATSAALAHGAPGAASGSLDLLATARLCTDFARVREKADLQTLLERAANLLDASGIIVWVDDVASAQLWPVMSFGYSGQALARIRSIARNDENVTARACREQTLRVVEEDGVSNGAIAAPLMGPDGCVGVMAAEIRRGRERRADVQAAAMIVAAQIATLVAPAGAEEAVKG